MDLLSSLQQSFSLTDSQCPFICNDNWGFVLRSSKKEICYLMRKNLFWKALGDMRKALPPGEKIISVDYKKINLILAVRLN